jgi:hypothetical protein
MPTVTFEGELTRRVGNKTVRLIQVGPAHTRGDVLAYVPQDPRALRRNDYQVAGQGDPTAH